MDKIKSYRDLQIWQKQSNWRSMFIRSQRHFQNLRYSDDRSTSSISVSMLLSTADRLLPATSD